MKIFTVAVAMLAMLLLAGCVGETSNSQTTEQRATERNQAQLNQAQPVPAFSFSQERETLIQIYRLRNDARNTYTVFYSDLGTPLWTCPSIGYPIPGGTQITNPSKIVENVYIGQDGKTYRGAGYSVVPLAEPNGLYTDPNTNSTWVLCVRQGGEIVPVYSEPKVMTFPFLVRIEGGQVVDAGESPSAVIEVKD